MSSPFLRLKEVIKIKYERNGQGYVDPVYSAVVANEDACSCQNNINNLRKNNKCYLSFGYKRFPERSNAVLQVVIHKDYTIVEMKRHATPVEENESGLIFLGTGRADDDFILSQAEKFLGGNYLV